MNRNLKNRIRLIFVSNVNATLMNKLKIIKNDYLLNKINFQFQIDKVVSNQIIKILISKVKEVKVITILQLISRKIIIMIIMILISIKNNI